MLDSEVRQVAQVAVRASTVEIRAHQFLLLSIFLPFAGILLPFLGFHITCSLLNSNLSKDWRDWKHIRQVNDEDVLTGTQELALAGSLTFAICLYDFNRYAGGLRKLRSAEDTDSRYRPLKPGQGTALKAREALLWKSVVASENAAPEIVWFPNVAVLARALSKRGEPRIAISTGLWERLEKGDQTAELILLHEMAHLRFGDPERFLRFTAVLNAIQKALSVTFFSFAFIVGFLALHQVFALFRTPPLSTLLRQELMIISVGLIVISLCPITGAIVRRYMGFITSLVELRADVRAAEWAGGLDHFAGILASNELVHRSTLADRSRSLFSLDLTHLSETERIDAIRDPARLLAPKTEYFVFSLILALILPFNGLTPLFAGGLADITASIAVAVAFSLTTVTMLSLGAATPVRMPVRKLVGLAVGVVGFTAACQLNLYTFAYSLMTIAVEFGLPSPDTPVDLKEIVHDIGASFGDVAGQFDGIFSKGWIAGSVVVTVAALGLLIIGAKRLGSKNGISRASLFVIGIAGVAGAVLDSFDQWRTSELEGTWIYLLW